MRHDNLSMADGLVDDSICPICGGSTYQGETISCETCLHWFHFQCVGVTHEDACVISEDIPFYCPSCDVKQRKIQNKSLVPGNKRQSQTAKTKARKHGKKSVGARSKKKREIKLKISLKGSEESPFSESKEYQDGDSILSPDSDTSIEQPLIIDEIAPRTVKVGRRRPSQRQGGVSELKPEESLGFELQMENLEAFIKDVPCKSLDDFVTTCKPSTKCNFISSPSFDRWSTSEVPRGIQEEVITVQTENFEFPHETMKKEISAVPGDLEDLSEEMREESPRHLEDLVDEVRREPRNLTIRQRFRLEGIDSDDSLLSLDFSGKKKLDSKENLADKALKAQKRRDLESEKKEKIKKKTMDTLLKKKDSKISKQIKVAKAQNDNIPKISYVSNANSRSLTFPASLQYPLKAQPPKLPPEIILCSVCSKPKKYNCSKTGNPLCSLECYKINSQNHITSSNL